MRKIFYEELTKKYFIEINENNNFKDKGKVKGYKELDIPLQTSEWRNLYSHIKRGSGLASSNEALWFMDMDPFLVRLMLKSD